MCQFFSGIVKKTSGKVLHLRDGIDRPNVGNRESHDEIIKVFKLLYSDDTKKWLRFEVLQNNGDNHNKDIKTWDIKIDSPTTPDWYMRNKTYYDEKIFDALKIAIKNLPRKVKRFDSNEESKLIKTLSTIFGDGGISEEDAVEKDELIAVDPAHVLMCVAKTEEAKRILCRFCGEGTTKKVVFNWTVDKNTLKDCKDGKYHPRALISIEYIQKAIKVIECISDHIALTIKYENPVRIENEHFEFVIAPRVESE